MSFVLFGPGISDHLTLDQALAQPVWQAAPRAIDPIARTRAITQSEPDARGQSTVPRAPEPAPPFAAEVEAYQTVKRAQHEVGPVQVAEQIMTSKVVSLLPEAPISALRQLFDERKIGLVPLINQENQLVGVVTKGDLTRQRVRFTDLAPRAVATIANHSVLTATPQTNIRELARVLLAQDIRGLPIVDAPNDDAQKVVVGIVTRGDILQALVNYAPLELWL